MHAVQHRQFGSISANQRAWLVETDRAKSQLFGYLSAFSLFTRDLQKVIINIIINIKHYFI